MIAVAEQAANLRHTLSTIFLQLVHRQVARVRDVARAAAAPQIDGVGARPAAHGVDDRVCAGGFVARAERGG